MKVSFHKLEEEKEKRNKFFINIFNTMLIIYYKIISEMKIKDVYDDEREEKLRQEYFDAERNAEKHAD